MACTETATTCVIAAGEGEDNGMVAGWLMDAWEKICYSFADAAVAMLEGFGKAFTVFPDIDLSGGGIANAYAISMGLGILVAAILMLIQTGATAFTASGRPLAQAFVGLGKTVMAFVLTLTFAGTALAASDQIADWIIEETFATDSATGSTVLQDKLATLYAMNSVNAIALVLIMAICGILLTLVLWFELLLRNAAIAVLIATSPIAAAGQIGNSTKDWWPKLVRSTIQLILLKPVIALIFAVGFSLLGQSDMDDMTGMLSGMLVLLIAALAWPAIARFMTFTSTTVGGGSGLAALAGAGAGMASQAASPAGVAPGQFAQAASARSENTVARAQQAASSGGRAAGAGAAGKTAGAAGKAAGAAKFAGPWGMAAAAGLQMAQKGANTLVQRTEQMGGHAGIQGSNPYALPAGQSMQNLSAIQAAQRIGADTSGERRPGPGAPREPEPPPPPAPAPPNSTLSGNEPKDGGPS